MTQQASRAVDRWGDYDRDCPFSLFADVRAAGPVLPAGVQVLVLLRASVPVETSS